jgi:asparagine synthetase B (glutamine-hydrolysing)
VERNTVSKDLFLDHAIQRHYRQWPYDPRAGEQANAIRTKIAEQLKLPEKMSSEEAASHFETFYWLEQQPKFILNSMRVYEFFGLEWRLPWWDKELLEYWKRIPMAKRAGREFYKRYVSALRDTGFPVYKKESLIRRMEDRVIRQRWGYLYESRWSRFADLTKDKESRSTTVQGLLPQGLDLPAFVNPKQRIVDTDINGLQSLVAIKEWWEEGHRV